jgi:hypothetical protein
MGDFPHPQTPSGRVGSVRNRRDGAWDYGRSRAYPRGSRTHPSPWLFHGTDGNALQRVGSCPDQWPQSGRSHPFSRQRGEEIPHCRHPKTAVSAIRTVHPISADRPVRGQGRRSRADIPHLPRGVEEELTSGHHRSGCPRRRSPGCWAAV